MSEEQQKSKESIVPDMVANEEMVARVVLDPLYLQDGKLGRSAFELRDTKRMPNEQYVSVNRMSYWNAEKEAPLFHAPKGNTVGGYAKMKAADIRDISGAVGDQTIEVDVKPEKGDSPQSAHAGIFTLVNSKAVTGAVKKHVSAMWMYVQSRLLGVAEYVQFTRLGDSDK